MLKETSLSVARREPQEHLVVHYAVKKVILCLIWLKTLPLFYRNMKLTVNKVLMANALILRLDKP